MDKKSLNYQVKSFGWAYNGLSDFFKRETKAKIHFIATITVIVFGILLKIPITEWCIVTKVIGFVFVTEIINTAVETLVDTIPDNMFEVWSIMLLISVMLLLIYFSIKYLLHPKIYLNEN